MRSIDLQSGTARAIKTSGSLAPRKKEKAERAWNSWNGRLAFIPVRAARGTSRQRGNREITRKDAKFERQEEESPLPFAFEISRPFAPFRG
jgi:hypothetical protein